MDESFRDILPYLRPRTGEVSWFVWVVLSLLLLIILGNIAAAFLIKRRQKQKVWKTFDTIATERGLSKAQRRLLARIARQEGMKNPLLLLSSTKSFDQHVGARAARLAGERRLASQTVLDDISRMRKLLGFDRIHTGQSMLTTRQLQSGQTLMVWPEKGGPEGFVHCAVVARDDRAITAVPLLKEDDRFLASLEVGDRIKVRFWDEDKVEYRFRTRIFDAVPETTTILLCHAESLERVQPYDFFRLHVAFGLLFYVVSREVYETLSLEKARSQQRARPIQGQVFYISGDGLGIFTKDQIPPDHLLIIDPEFRGTFPLKGIACALKEAREEGDRRRLHLHFVNLAPGEQNAIIARIYRQQVRMAHPR